MAKQLYGLTQGDRDKIAAGLRRLGGGKGVPSSRPVPTRRRGGDTSGNAIWVIATLDAAMVSGAATLATVNDFGGPPSFRSNPANASGQVKIESGFASNVASGTKVLAIVSDTNTEPDPKIYELVTDNTGGGGGGDLPDVGCGLEYVADVLVVDTAALAGKGLAVGDSSLVCNEAGSDTTYCCLYIDIDCGLTFNGNKIAVDTAALAGRGLTATAGTGDCETYAAAGWEDTYCCLSVVLGCGLQFDGDAIAVDPLTLAGCGLKVGSGECDLDVDNEDLAGAGLEAGSGCSLNVLVDPAYFAINIDNQITQANPCNAIKTVECAMEVSEGKLKITLSGTYCDDTTWENDPCELELSEGCTS